MSEYEPVFGARAVTDRGDLEAARSLFARASRPYLTSPVPWCAWALVLPAAALATRAVAGAAGAPGVLGLWSGAIVLGGAVEIAFLLRARRHQSGNALGSWAMTSQGNLSLVAVALSAALVFAGHAELLPGLWLLLLGHSLFTLGGLAFRPQRTAGVFYQVGGACALLPGAPALAIFAVATALGNLWIAVGVARRPVERLPGR
jgi:hypothetical protein